jgi:predicted PhzF superfamily epimerase YddE/YHI9
MQVDVQIVNAFIDGNPGGNPAGVVVDANALTAAQKLQVAQQVGLSETAFVSASDTATIKLEFFTPLRQIAHCGHATIATFSLLRQLGVVGEGHHSKETIDGNRDILVEGEMAFMEQRAPQYNPVAVTSEVGGRVVASLGLAQSASPIRGDPFVVNTGNAFLLIPMPNESAGQTQTTPSPGPVTQRWIRSDRLLCILDNYEGTGPLACFLHDHLGVADREILIEQGWLMQPPSPSVIKVVLELVDGQISRLMAGGAARVMSTLRVEV